MSDVKSLKYRAFISYSHADSRWTKWLHTRLEAFAIDNDLIGRKTAAGVVPESLRPIFRDRNEFTAGQTLDEQTISALDDSAALVVVCSPKAAQSHYVNEEIRLFRMRHRDRPAIPVIVDGRPDGGENECFPPALRFEINADGAITNQSTQLLAADVRHEGDGRHLALAKVVASLLQVGTDEIFRRTERRRRRQTRFRVGVGVLLFVLLIAASNFALLNYQKQQTLAEIEFLVAKYSPISEAQAAGTGIKPNLPDAITAIAQGAANDPRYKQALILLKEGKPDQAVPLLRAVAEESAQRVDQDRKKTADVYRHLGTIAGLGDPRQARLAYDKALEFSPDDPEALYWSGFLSFLAGDLTSAERSLKRLMTVSVQTNSDRDLYRANMRLGEIDLARGNLISAMDHQKKAMGVAESASSRQPGNAEWQRDVSVSQEKIGDVLQAQGSLLVALENYKSSFSIRETLTKTYPDNTEWRRLLSISQNKIGDISQAQEDFSSALESYKAAFTIRQGLAKADPNNVAWQRDLSVSYDKLADLQKAQNKLPEALEDYKASFTIRERLAATDPRNAGWQRDISVSYERLGDLLFMQDNLSAAQENFKSSFEIRKRLTTADPDNAGWQRDLSVIYNKIGDALKGQGNLQAAFENFEASLVIRSRLSKLDPGNVGWQVDLALSNARIGRIYLTLSQKAEALQHFKTAREILVPLAERSGNKIWIRNIQKLDADIAAVRE